MCTRTAALIVLLSIALAHGSGSAQQAPDETLSTCVTQVVHEARSEGAKAYGAPTVDFLLVGEHRAYDYQLPHDGCFGFVAIGHRQVQHLDLTLYAPSGRILSHSSERDAHAYARFCGHAGRKFIVEVRMLDGEGEFHLVPLWNGPPTLRSLRSTINQCMEAGAPRPNPVDVGPEPLGPPLDVQLLTVTRKLATEGYRLENGLLFGGLPERRREGRRIRLEADHCYALAAVGDAYVADIDLRLLAVRETPAVVAMDVTRKRDAIVKVCPDESDTYVLDVRMYSGGGHYVVQSFGLIESKAAAKVGVEGGMRIPYAETVARLRRLGMEAEPLTWGLVKPGEAQEVPLSLAKGNCYAVAAIATQDFAGGDIDMSLLDAHGGFAAGEQGSSPNPLVFQCADEDAVYKAVVRSHGIRRPGRFMLLLGKEAPRKQEPIEVTL